MQGMVEPDEARAIYHAEVIRQAERAGPKPPRETQAGQQVEQDLSGGETAIKRAAPQQQIRATGREHRKWDKKPRDFVRKEEEERCGLKGPEQKRDVAKLL